MNSTEQTIEIAERYLTALKLGEQELARSLIFEALSRGLSQTDVYLEVLEPVQVKMGELWHAGEINAAQEHMGMSITLGIMDMLRLDMVPRARLGKRVIVTPVEGEEHFIGARLIADFLAMDGWEVDFLSIGTPPRDLSEFAKLRKAQLVAISVSQNDALESVRATATAIRGLPSPTPKVLVGGSAVANTNHEPDAFRCDAIAHDALEALAEARRLVDLTPAVTTLKDQLSWLGTHIREARTEQKMTQRQLAESSRLERSYISAVEHGRQNITIGAALRIAHALGLTISDLLAPPTTLTR